MTVNLKEKISHFLLPYVKNPLQYIGGELNIIKKELSSVSVHGVLCFPETYEIGMSHTGLQILYNIINSRKEWALSRCFHPWIDAEEIMRRESIPLYTLEYFSPVKECDVVGFSLQYELQYTNVINMLDLAGITHFTKERKEEEPLIIAGGPCCINPEPMAYFIDAFVIGDGEEIISQIFSSVEKRKKLKLSRQQLFEELDGIKGCYVPSLYKERGNEYFIIPYRQDNKIVEIAKVKSLKNEYYPLKPIVPLSEIVHGRLTVEVMRGCSRGCRFCSAGFFYRPVRERNYKEISRQIKENIQTTGWREIGLLSLSTADYSKLSSLLQTLSEFNEEYRIICSLPSTRIDALTEEQLNLIYKISNISSFTIAPEAATEHLRRVINKDFSNETIYKTVDLLMKNNIQTLKLYFMVGLPTECKDDIDGIIEMVSEISKRVKTFSSRKMINVSLSPFSPKPHTPFQWEKMEDIGSILEKEDYIKKSLSHLRNVKVSYRNPEQTALETILARGDRTISKLIYNVWKKGAKLEGWEDFFNFNRWIETAKELCIDINKYLKEIPENIELPWSIISIGVSHKFLRDERKLAYRGEPREDCRKGRCYNCGVCNSEIKPLIITADEKKISVKDIPKPIVKKKEEIYKWRFYYRKIGLIRFLGHLDMVEVISRALIISGLPLEYSKGFNPRPKISFGPPLPYGAESVREAFDIELYTSSQPDFSFVNKYLPEGLEIIDIKPLGRDEPSLNSSIFYAEYQFTFYNSFDFKEITYQLSRYFSMNSLVITVEKEGKEIKKDIRKGIIKVDLSDLSNKKMFAILSLKPPFTCKPSEFLKLFPNSHFRENVLIRRVNCFTEKMERV